MELTANDAGRLARTDKNVLFRSLTRTSPLSLHGVERGTDGLLATFDAVFRQTVDVQQEAPPGSDIQQSDSAKREDDATVHQNDDERDDKVSDKHDEKVNNQDRADATLKPVETQNVEHEDAADDVQASEELDKGTEQNPEVSEAVQLEEVPTEDARPDTGNEAGEQVAAALAQIATLVPGNHETKEQVPTSPEQLAAVPKSELSAVDKTGQAIRQTGRSQSDPGAALADSLTPAETVEAVAKNVQSSEELEAGLTQSSVETNSDDQLNESGANRGRRNRRGGDSRDRHDEPTRNDSTSVSQPNSNGLRVVVNDKLGYNAVDSETTDLASTPQTISPGDISNIVEAASVSSLATVAAPTVAAATNAERVTSDIASSGDSQSESKGSVEGLQRRGDSPRSGEISTSSVESGTNEMRVRLVQRVSRAFQRLGPDGGRINIMLHPAELGSLRLELTIEGSHLNAKMTTETDAALSILREHLPELRQRLAETGIVVEKMELNLVEQDASGHYFGTEQGSDADRWRDDKTTFLSGNGRRTNSASSESRVTSEHTTHVTRGFVAAGRGLDVRV